MNDFDWFREELNRFSITNIENRVNADKLFVSFLWEIEKQNFDLNKAFKIKEIADIIPRGTAGVNNYSTYGFSFMSMLSGQKNRDYFLFDNPDLRDEFTSICNNNYDRDNYYWKKHYANEIVRINPKYFKHGEPSKKQFHKVIGIGWDVGGWMGSNHGLAICEWDRKSGTINWIGKETEVTIPENSLMSLKRLTQEVDPSFEVHRIEDDTLVVIGIDAPLGYPSEFIQLLNGGMPSILKPEKEIYNNLAYRATDQEIHKVFGKKPLSATFDRIGNNATVAMLHIRNWEKENGFKTYPFEEKNHEDNRIILEVYPALVKKKRFEEVHEGLREFLPTGIQPGTDAYDACICALYSIAYGTDGSLLPKLEEPPEVLKLEVKEEGWIYYFKKS